MKSQIWHICFTEWKSLSQSCHQCQALRLQVKLVKASSFSSCCISSCEIYSLSLLAIFSILPAQKKQTAQNKTQPCHIQVCPQPCMDRHPLGSVLWSQWDFFPFVPKQFRGKGRRDFQCSRVSQSDFFQYILEWEDGSPPPSQQVSQPGKKWDGKLNSWFKIISGWGFARGITAVTCPPL